MHDTQRLHPALGTLKLKFVIQTSKRKPTADTLLAGGRSPPDRPSGTVKQPKVRNTNISSDFQRAKSSRPATLAHLSEATTQARTLKLKVVIQPLKRKPKGGRPAIGVSRRAKGRKKGETGKATRLVLTAHHPRRIGISKETASQAEKLREIPDAKIAQAEQE